ncbi:MAG: hypothetical protein JWM21_861 [Acidobacteria bacterium]|nr:hypothetical protein [Acidobacteriota bacterium]
MVYDHWYFLVIRKTAGKRGDARDQLTALDEGKKGDCSLRVCFGKAEQEAVFPMVRFEP